MTAAPEASSTDWRGTPITEGALVIYGAPVGRSIALVEAEVVGFTESGRVNLRIIRRAYGWTDARSKDVVHVGADRLIVVNDLPPTDVPLQADVKAEKQRAAEERKRLFATHEWPAPREEEFQGRPTYGGYGTQTRTRTVQDPCTKCGAERYSAEAGRECPR